MSRFFLLPLDFFCILILKLYQKIISPLKPKVCAFLPSCSTYMIGAIRQFHCIKGVWIGFKRLLRCKPKNKGKFDPVPVNIKGDSKWIL